MKIALSSANLSALSARFGFVGLDLFGLLFAALPVGLFACHGSCDQATLDVRIGSVRLRPTIARMFNLPEWDS